MSELTDQQADAMARAQAVLRDAGLDPTTITLSGGRTIAQLIAAEAPLLKPGTRRTYRTHLLRFEHGIGPICDQTCEPCLDPTTDFACRCDCKACRDSRIALGPQGDRMPLDAFTTANARTLAAVAGRYALKNGIVANRARAERGLPAKTAPGTGATETAIAAVRWLYGRAPEVGRGPALEVDKPHRSPGRRHALADFELIELYQVTCTGGDDPALDQLVVDIGVEVGTRREGACLLTVGQLYPTRQIISVIDKYKRPVDMPCSRELMDRILDHAITRGGPACEPTNPAYRPDSAALWGRRRGSRSAVALTSRRFDTLHERWHRALPWAAEEQVSYHWIRHTMAGILKSTFGPQYAKRYLRHADGDVTEIYGACTLEQLARAMSELLGYEHPLVTEHSARRGAVMDRLFGADLPEPQ